MTLSLNGLHVSLKREILARQYLRSVVQTGHIKLCCWKTPFNNIYNITLKELNPTDM